MTINEVRTLDKKELLDKLPERKLLINTINAHSFNISKEDSQFSEALKNGDVLLPDGVGIVYALAFKNKIKVEKIAGADLFEFEMNKLNRKGGDCFFLGSSEEVLLKIKNRAKTEYPNIRIHTYSPPYKPEFSQEDNDQMIQKINQVNPDLLWIGMTAPKQEKWAYANFDKLNVKGHIGCIGAVFDFYAGSVNRAPAWMIDMGMEWFHRLCSNPKRMWRRYLIGNVKFIYNVLSEKS